MKLLLKSPANLILTILVFFGIKLNNFNAQVGIGVANPNTNSILDLTNTNNKGLLLPFSSTQPTAGSYPEGMIFYFDSMVYVRNANGFNGISPWKYRYNGSTNEAVYFNPTSYMGVGIGVNDTAILGNLHISLNSKQVAATGTSAALFIGNSDAGTHLIMDNDEIMVKSTSTTGGILKLQEGAGSVQIGQDINNPSNLNVFGKVKENGKDLMPRGMIMMWSGNRNDIPGGWALCDGKYYDPADTSNGQIGKPTSDAIHTVFTPNLRGRFIVGYDSNAVATPTNATAKEINNGAIGNTGGENVHLLTSAESGLPSHDHSINHGHNISDPGHNHGIRSPDAGSGCYRLAGDDDDCASGPNNSLVEQAFTGITVDGHTGNSGSNTAANASQSHENRPPYFVLAFIMKL